MKKGSWRSQVMQVRVSAEEKAEFKKLAALSGKALSEWVREELGAALERTAQSSLVEGSQKLRTGGGGKDGS